MVFSKDCNHSNSRGDDILLIYQIVPFIGKKLPLQISSENENVKMNLHGGANFHPGFQPLVPFCTLPEITPQ